MTALPSHADQAVQVEVQRADSADARALIEASQAFHLTVYAPDEIFSLSAEELVAPNVLFLMAYLQGEPAGCVALVDMGEYGEIKRLYVTDAARGRGIGALLMATVEEAARDIGLAVIQLETGPKLVAAEVLYRRLGYLERGPFGDYAEHPASLFLEKRL